MTEQTGGHRPDPIHHQLLMAFSHSNRLMMARTRAIGLMPGQPKVLEYLAGNDGCAQRQIARACIMDASTVTGVLTRMEEAGLITRAHDPRDRRAVSVSLTESGREAANRVLSFGREVDDACLRGHGEDERAMLSQLLDRVVANLESAGETTAESEAGRR